MSKGNPKEIAKGVWDFGQLMGVTFKGPDGEIVSRLEGMEVRDREAAGNSGGPARVG